MEVKIKFNDIPKIGDRVGVVSEIGDDIIMFYGYGVYVRDDTISFMGMDIDTPTLLLDNGGEVHGFECWWSSEESIRQLMETLTASGFIIINVPVDTKSQETVL